MKLESPKVMLASAARHLKSHRIEVAQTAAFVAAYETLSLLNMRSPQIDYFLMGLTLYTAGRFFDEPRRDIFVLGGILAGGWATLDWLTDLDPTSNPTDALFMAPGVATWEILASGTRLIRKGHQRFNAS